MSLHCLALLGNNNAPIYLCASNINNSTSINNNINNDTNKIEDNENDIPLPPSPSPSLSLPSPSINKEDFFGFFGDSSSSNDRQQIDERLGTTKRPIVSMRHEMMFHAALDRLEELLGSNRKTSWKRFQRGSHWIGKICPMEEYEIYGYVTSSDVKILALIERDGIIPLKKRKEVDIKIMFTAIHDCYVKHTLNPFSKIKGNIEPPCNEFEINIQAAMGQYNDAVNGN